MSIQVVLNEKTDNYHLCEVVSNKIIVDYGELGSARLNDNRPLKFTNTNFGSGDAATLSEILSGTEVESRSISPYDLYVAAQEQLRQYGTLLYRMVSAWPLDEVGTGTRFDKIAANTNNLTPQNTVTDESANNGTGFYGTSARLETNFSESPTLYLPGSTGVASELPFTVAFRVKMSNSDATTNRFLFGRWRSASNSKGFGIVHTPGGNIRIQVSSDGTTNDLVSTGIAVSDDTFYIVVCRYFGDGLSANGKGFDLRVGGTAEASNYSAGGVYYASYTDVGHNADFVTSGTDALIQQLYFWDRALTDEEVAILENEGNYTFLF